MATAGLLSPNNINYRPSATPASPTLIPGITASNVNNLNSQISSLAKVYQGYYNDDEILQAQRSALEARLKGTWSGFGGFVPQAQQLLNAYGGALPAGLQSMVAPQFHGHDLGMSLIQALSDPQQMAAAQSNPYSTMAGITNTYDARRFQGMHGLGGRGLARSGAVHALGNQLNFQEGAARSDATGKFLDALTTAYGGVLGNVDKAYDTESGYYQSAFDRASELIKNNILGTPTTAKAAPTTRTNGTNNPAVPTGPNPRGYPMAGIPGVWGGLSPNTSLPQYTPKSQSYVGPTGYRSPMGAEQGMYHLGSGFKITPRGRLPY